MGVGDAPFSRSGEGRHCLAFVGCFRSAPKDEFARARSDGVLDRRVFGLDIGV